MIRWLLAALADWMVIIAAMAAIWRWPLCAPLAIFAIGTRQHALAILGHDGTHGLISKNRALNDALGSLALWPVSVGIDGYRGFHLLHHRNLGWHGGPDGDPELELKARSGWYGLPITKSRVFWLFIGDLLGITSTRDTIAVIQMMWRFTSPRDAIGVVATWSIAAVLLWRFDQLWILAVWVIAQYTSNWAVNRLRVWREHVGTAGTNHLPIPWWGFMVHLPHNVGHHAEHHHYAFRPFYRLGQWPS